MIKKSIRSIAFLLMLMLSFTFFSIPVFAASNRTLEPSLILSEAEKDILDEWVGLNSNQFFIKEGAQEALDTILYDKLVSCIQTSNQNIAKADFSSGEAFVVAPEDETEVVSMSISRRPSYREGVTKIEFHYWGVRVWLSKTTVQCIGAGVAIAGIWIPEPVVSKIASTLGVIVALCPGGIRFDYNVWLGVAGGVVPGATIVFGRAVNNIRFQ